MSHDHLINPLLAQLHNQGRLRVWSIVISIFGELVNPRQTPISVQELLALTETIGVEGNALRTALSRLAQEGWVARQKVGRNSFYTLDESGVQTVSEASERIYSARFDAASPDWLLVHRSRPAEDGSPGLVLDRNTVLLSADDRSKIDDPDAFVMSARPEHIPAWARERLLPADLGEQYATFLRSLAPLLDDPKAVSCLSPIAAMACRVLVIHFWRRLVLRHPVLPLGLVPEGWPGLECHAAIREIYPRLITPSERWWGEKTDAEGLKTLKARFK